MYPQEDTRLDYTKYQGQSPKMVTFTTPLPRSISNIDDAEKLIVSLQEFIDAKKQQIRENMEIVERRDILHLQFAQDVCARHKIHWTEEKHVGLLRIAGSITGILMDEDWDVKQMQKLVTAMDRVIDELKLGV